MEEEVEVEEEEEKEEEVEEAAAVVEGGGGGGGGGGSLVVEVMLGAMAVPLKLWLILLQQLQVPTRRSQSHTHNSIPDSLIKTRLRPITP